MSCSNLKGLLEAEIPGLETSMGHRRYLLSKREGKKDPSEIDWKRAKEEWLNEKGDSWMEGFKYAYCNYVCPNREGCELRELDINKWRQYANGSNC